MFGRRWREGEEGLGCAVEAGEQGRMRNGQPWRRWLPGGDLGRGHCRDGWLSWGSVPSGAGRLAGCGRGKLVASGL